MQRPHVAIRAVFATSAAFFDLPRAATFEQLADRLCGLSERRAAALTGIELVTELPDDAGHAQAELIRRLSALDDDGASAASP
jgi:hypothetical protein